VSAGTIQAELCQYLQASEDYQKPYFILWYSHSYFSFLLPIYFGWRFLQDQFSLDPCLTELGIDIRSILHGAKVMHAGDMRLTKHDAKLLFKRCACLVVPLTAAAFFWYLGAALTTPSRLAAAANTACCFAYVFEVFMFNHPWRRRTICAVLIGVGGVVTMSVLSSREAPIGIDAAHPNRIGNPWRLAAGDLAGLTSAALTGYFENLFKRHLVPKHGTNSVTASLFITGVLGLCTFGLMWIPIPFLHWFRWETFALPTRLALQQMTINAVLSTLFNLGFLVVIAQAGPVVAAVGIMLGLPAIGLADVLVMGRGLGLGVLIGGAMVMLAFSMIVTQPGSTHAAGGYKVANQVDGGNAGGEEEYSMEDFEREYGHDAA